MNFFKKFLNHNKCLFIYLFFYIFKKKRKQNSVKKYYTVKKYVESAINKIFNIVQ